MIKKTNRRLPRPFSLHWGDGYIVEEATYAGEHHEPTVQLLEFEDGAVSIRFCYYDHAGRFQRSPLMVSADEVAGLRDALKNTPRLKALLGDLAGCS